MKTTKCILGAMLLTTFFSCNNQLKNASILKQSDFEKNLETIFNDFKLNDLNLDNIVKEEKEKDYFDNIVGIK